MTECVRDTSEQIAIDLFRSLEQRSNRSSLAVAFRLALQIQGDLDMASDSD